jgi:hypothetical protein
MIGYKGIVGHIIMPIGYYEFTNSDYCCPTCGHRTKVPCPSRLGPYDAWLFYCGCILHQTGNQFGVFHKCEANLYRHILIDGPPAAKGTNFQSDHVCESHEYQSYNEFHHYTKLNVMDKTVTMTYCGTTEAISTTIFVIFGTTEIAQI